MSGGAGTALCSNPPLPRSLLPSRDHAPSTRISLLLHPAASPSIHSTPILRIPRFTLGSRRKEPLEKVSVYNSVSRGRFGSNLLPNTCSPRRRVLTLVH
ncbi:hypothetical protein AVEN_230703-1 [Araneus ventricosus]|uniref:Uncharacterized protein n=1 Tax=Araneus ventricosus TaxID=182803 RepID=A0A4Y2A2E5_ARAVE|nr:hypothetical protein AVEN_230703-1 [Araneus ventricosus]